MPRARRFARRVWLVNLTDYLVACLLHEPGQHPDTVVKQRTVGGVVDIRGDHRAIHPHGLAFFHVEASGFLDDEAVDEFEGLRLDLLDVLLQRGFAGRLFINAKTAESAVTAGVGQVEGQLLVAEAVHLLENQGPQDLVAGQAGTPGADIRLVSGQIVVDQGCRRGHAIQKVGDSAEFSTVFMGDKRIDKRALLLYLVSQRDVTSMCKMFP